MGKREKGRGRREEGVPGLREFLAHGLGTGGRAGQVLGNIHLTSPSVLCLLRQTPLTQGPTPWYVPFLLRTQWKTSLMCVERVMHVHGGPVPWTVYLHGKVLGRQGWHGSLRHLPAGARDRTMDACQKVEW